MSLKTLFSRARFAQGHLNNGKYREGVAK